MNKRCGKPTRLPNLAARGESTRGRAPRYCGQDQGARRRRCGDIVDDEQRRDCPQYLGAQRVPAALGKGPNIVRCAVANGGGATDFCARFLDKNDAPVKGFTVNLGEAGK